jgi:hypothetical protein
MHGGLIPADVDVVRARGQRGEQHRLADFGQRTGAIDDDLGPLNAVTSASCSSSASRQSVAPTSEASFSSSGRLRPHAMNGTSAASSAAHTRPPTSPVAP